ncbi:uncharacterized protein LOC102396267 isoform X2 [Bubalus bubalis]|uniref:uncharacterized protein LOC102396267 isoform X2 n=1 Tax=Bubalus bubalis TaxID=89462 RepID=UPI001E1B7398|nr:uncharacterized protein LOC102396267 isoform X2 [Bubalus bubalis]
MQLLQCPDVAAAADDEMVRTLANWFQREEPAVVKLLLRAVGILSRHENTGKQLRALQPYVLSCCYSADGSVVAETFQVLRDLVDQLPWQHSAAFLIQLAFTLAPFLEEVRPPRPVSLLGHRLSSNGVARTVSEALRLDGDACEGADSHGPRPGDGPEGRGQSQWGRDDGGPADGGGLRATVWKAGLHCLPLTWVHVCVLPQESEHLRLTAFEIYGALLAKVSRRVFVFPLRHQVLNLLILLVLHLEDANGRIAQIARPTLCHLATLLGWSKLRATFAEKDVWTILSALLQQEVDRALWFLKQSVQLFRSPQVPIRRAAVWFAALRHMRADPDPTVSCLATQTSYILEAKEKTWVASSTSCFCPRRLRKAYF